MEIHIKNLGKVKKAEISLRNLTIFVGKNNTNKTWTAYVISAFSSLYFLASFTTKVLTDGRFYKSKTIQQLLNISDNISKYLQKYESKEELKHNLKKYLDHALDKKLVKNLLDKYSKYISNNFHLFISVESDVLEDFKIQIKLDEKDFRKIKDTIISNAINYKEEYLKDISSRFHFLLLFKDIIYSLFGKSFNLPAEREALVIFANLITLGERNLDNLKAEVLEALTSEIYKAMESSLKSERSKYSPNLFMRVIGDTIRSIISFEYNYPMPINEFKDFILRIKQVKQNKNIFSELAYILQERILEGKIQVDTSSGALYFLPDTIHEKKLNVSSSSSMVKSLSSLYLYLKFLAKEGNLLIIDEPEMNLHPEAQVKLIEFLSILANSGLKILITTHTPYVIDHVINLIEAYDKRKEEGIENLFMLKDKRSFISPYEVSVYFFDDDGIVKNILDRKERIINWETFSKVSDYVANIYSRILEYHKEK